MGGEKRRNLMNEQKEKGSPPRGRGKVQFGIHALGGVGITPAWAGKSFPTNGDSVAKQGSPPRGRGKAPRTAPGKLGGRITPAWAGKSLR